MSLVPQSHFCASLAASSRSQSSRDSAGSDLSPLREPMSQATCHFNESSFLVSERPVVDGWAWRLEAPRDRTFNLGFTEFWSTYYIPGSFRLFTYTILLDIFNCMK